MPYLEPGEPNPFDPPENDVAGHDFDALADFDSGPYVDDEGDVNEQRGRQESAAAKLTKLAMGRYTMVKDQSGHIYAEDSQRPGIALPLRGAGGVRTELARLYYQASGRPAPSAALSDTIAVLEGEGAMKEPRPVFLRHGQTRAGERVLDLGTESAEVVVIDARGWHIVSPSPVLFRRSAITEPMPRPVAGGTLDRFRALLNCDDEGFRLLVGWMVIALCENVQSPILSLTGQQGSAKSSALRMVIDLVDSSAAPLKSPPRDEDTWAITANASAVIGVDNFSVCPPWLSDTLARTVSGDAVIKRALYSDQDVSVARYRRPVALTSISPEGLQADVADRLCTVELAPIPASERRKESDVLDEFAAIRAETLGALLDLLVRVEGALPNAIPDELPRLADAGLRLYALDEVTGWGTLDSFVESQEHAAEEVVEADVFAAAIINFARERTVFEGTVSELLRHISPSTPPKAWPRNARAASVRLQRIAPALVHSGVKAEQLPRVKNVRIWRIVHTPLPGERLCEKCLQPLHSSLPDSITVHATCAENDDESEPRL